MSRLIDRILLNGAIPNPGISTFDYEHCLKEIKSAHFIVADNVCDFFWHTPEPRPCRLERDFVSLAPPFKNFFVESRLPGKFLNNGQMQKWDVDAPLESGVLFQYLEVRDGKISNHLNPEMQLKITNAIRFGHKVKDPRMIDVSIEELDNIENPLEVYHKWICYIDLFLGFKEKVIGPVLSWIFFVKPTGVPSRWNFPITEGWGNLSESAASTLRGIYINSTLFAVSLMNCKNITLKVVRPPEKLSRAFQKRHGKPLVRYHVLEIEPMKKVLREEGQAEKTGLKMALHICRGHFKDYREKGLFGSEKHRGVYWWDAQARGRIEEGIVAKDYSISTIKDSQ